MYNLREHHTINISARCHEAQATNLREWWQDLALGPWQIGFFLALLATWLAAAEEKKMPAWLAKEEKWLLQKKVPLKSALEEKVEISITS